MTPSRSIRRIAPTRRSNRGRWPTRVGVARFLTDGTLDPSWGSGGVVWLDFGVEMHLTSIALDADGGLVLGLSIVQVADDEDEYPTETASVAHLSADGILDETYRDRWPGRAPRRRSGRRREDRLRGPGGGLHLDREGRDGRHEPIYRLLADGGLDPDFGDAGATEIIGQGLDQEIALDAEDRIVVSQHRGRHDSYLEVTRLSVDGTVDERFGEEDGTIWVRLDERIGSDNPLAIDGEGRIIIAANVRSARTGDGGGDDRRSTDFGLVRIEADGADVDESFGDDGLLQIDIRDQKDRVAAVAMGLDGSIVVSGGARVPGKRGMKGAVAVIPADGSGGE